MPSACCGDGQFCDFPWCDCTGNAEFRAAHKLVNPTDKEQDCGRPSCNYCNQIVRRDRAAGVEGREVPSPQEPVAMVVVSEGAEDEFFWAGRGALLELPPGEYDLYLAPNSGVRACPWPNCPHGAECIHARPVGVGEVDGGKRP